MNGLVETVASWPLAASIAATATALQLRSGRRRAALNEALHELRRPLQALALAAGPGGDSPRVVASSVQLAAAALERLEQEINGGAVGPRSGPMPVRPLLEAAVGRWGARARLADASLSLRWSAGGAAVVGDRLSLAQALDNLIVNAIEHGGCSIVVTARIRADRLRIAVVDSGRRSRPAHRRGTPAEVIARLSGRRRHGHGLAVVRRVAALHGGRFALRCSERGSLAVLELPLAAAGPRAA